MDVDRRWKFAEKPCDPYFPSKWMRFHFSSMQDGRKAPQTPTKNIPK